ncbi:hypothetical protein TKWG_07635 [Advenella kashmirensis WT001]|uniref:Uncharacterized protein n=1 Tax=Advenella kashmirensis (strain DSM 17095 / LMG 22695 / WT001) TaxID=1036672 RepID=I3UAA6_ADVKW|nr:hypothetical protein [Advenella kashmirensis]AFK61944.1 hypothetical protein TKWG_07635 [Advenella kashmirensis WT001]
MMPESVADLNPYLQQENMLNPPSINPQSMAAAEAQPLAGVKVIEICSTIAGPACGRCWLILAPMSSK